MRQPRIVWSVIASASLTACPDAPASSTEDATGRPTTGVETTQPSSTVPTTEPDTAAGTTGGPGTSGGTNLPTSDATVAVDVTTTTGDPGTGSPATCDDGVHNGDETDIDCGGACPGCLVDEHCVVDGDCESLVCTDGVCVPASCREDGDCPGGGACEQPVCNRDTMQCGLAALPDGTDCDDGFLCTMGPASCEGGSCKGGAIAPVSLAAMPAGAGFVIDGNLAKVGIGDRVHGLGDVNGDGLDDLAVSSQAYFEYAPGELGRIHVVFGKVGDGSVDVADVSAGIGGFIIRPIADVSVGRYVAPAGDLNQDGLADLVVASPTTFVNGPFGGSGLVFAVFGKADGEAVDLADVLAGEGGFAIRGVPSGQLGVGVGGAGDVDGDGRDDLLIGEPQHGAQPWHGRVLVVFGGDAQAVRTSDVIAGGQGGFLIAAEDDSDALGLSPLRSAGDVDGDGHADLLISDSASDAPFVNSGRLYFVRGKAGGTAIDLANVVAGQGGFVVTGAGPHGGLGSRAGDLGDVNDDGLRDFFVTAPYLYEGVDDPGSAYVVFGKLDGAPVDVADLAAGIGGYAITGAAMDDGFGYYADALGDLNGDGRGDFGIAALRTPYIQPFAGRVNVVLSAAAPASFAAATLAAGAGGFVIDGAKAQDGATRVAGAGDVNGDGVPDIAIGAIGVDEVLTDAGRVYVLFGPVCAP